VCSPSAPLGTGSRNDDKAARIQHSTIKTRMIVHGVIAVIFVLVILMFKALNNRSLIDAIYTIASYTYGPLLGLFSFGLFTKWKTNDKYVPFICIASPVICYLIRHFVYQYCGYLFGYELLILNGLITFVGLWIVKTKN
jgi:Na+/proline symporter